MKLYAIVVFLLFFNLKSKAQEVENGYRSGRYQTFSKDGAWCWFSDPRAVYLNGKIYSGWVAADGSIVVGSYDQETAEIKQVNLFPTFNKDDHANPTFLILPDKRIMVFFSAHNGKGFGEEKPAIFYTTSKKPEDISEWETLQRKTENVEGPKGFCYTNPVMLSAENNRIYIFWRGGDWKPTFSYTDDFGVTWSQPFTLVKSSLNEGKRPYVKVSSNGKDEIYFAFTDGHPGNEPLNSIYYLKYRVGKFYKADGTVVGSMHSLPLEHEDCDIVYDANQAFKVSRNGVRSWIWDVSSDKSGNPVLVYTRLPAETKHEYYYAKWNGDTWLDYKISSAGSFFPRYPKTKEMQEPEPHYSGGVYLDHENTNVVYYSRPIGDIFEIFKAETKDAGATWVEVSITSNSTKDNVRPFAIRGAGDDAKAQVLWMYNDQYTHYKEFKARIKMDLLEKKKE